MAQIAIRVGASVDRSLGVAFRPLIEGAKKARAAVESEGAKASRAISTSSKRGAKDAEAAFRELEREVAQGMPKIKNAGTRAIVDFAKEAKTNLGNVKKDFNSLANEAERQLARIEKAQKANAGRSLAGRAASFAFNKAGGMDGVKAGLSRSGRMAMGVGKAAAGAAFDLASSYARGIGVDTDVASLFSKNSDLQSMATNISNSGYIAGDKRNSKRVDTNTLMQEALSIGKSTGTDANEALEGLSKFTAKTGDLATGRELMKDLAIFAKATGTELSDMVDAAGDVASALPEGAEKSKSVLNVMRQIAAQGKLGAVEIKDLAVQMAKLSANAGQMEGSVADNILLLGAFTQKSRQLGGSVSAGGAATSVASLVNTFKTPARINAFEKLTGKKVFNDAGQMRNLQDLTMESLRAVGMDPKKFKQIFGNVQGARAVEGFATIYRQNGGGAAGEAAVTAEFDRLKKATLADSEVMESFAAQMRTGKSQAEVFNNSLRDSALSLQNVLLPAAMNLAPVLIKMADDAGVFISGLIGKDVTNKAQGDQIEQQVKSAMTETQKQLATGQIVDGQQEINKEAELRAFQQRTRAAQAIDDEKANQMGGITKFALKATDYVNPIQWVTNYMTNGATSGAAKVARDENRVTQAEAEYKKTDEQYKEIAAMNKRVGDLLQQHIIQVRVVEPIPPGAGSPPNVPGNGRQPSPEQKTER